MEVNGRKKPQAIVARELETPVLATALRAVCARTNEARSRAPRSGVRPGADFQTAKPRANPLRSSAPRKLERPGEVSLRESEIGAGTDAAPWDCSRRATHGRSPNGSQGRGYKGRRLRCS